MVLLKLYDNNIFALLFKFNLNKNKSYEKKNNYSICVCS